METRKIEESQERKVEKTEIPDKGTAENAPSENISQTKDELLTTTKQDAFKPVKRYILRIRLLSRSISLALILYLFFTEGWFWALGGLLGSLVVEGNLSIMYHTLVKSLPDRVEKPLWLTIIKFYLLFGLTLAVSAVVVILGLGNPFGFLAGILVFIPAFVGTFAWSGLEYFFSKKAKA